VTKRPSLFSAKTAQPAQEAETRATPAVTATEPETREGRSDAPAPSARYPKASTREAFRQLKRIAADEDRQQQDLLLEGINAVFEKRGLSRIA
jgi:hypothetical protein